MSTDFNNMEDMSVLEMLSFLDAKRIEADKKRKENQKLESAFESKKIIKPEVDTVSSCSDIENTKNEYKSFEKEANYYLEKILKLDDFDKEKVEEVLPSRHEYDHEEYKRIIHFIMSYFTREIIEINEIISELLNKPNPDIEELKEYKNEIIEPDSKLRVLNEILYTEEMLEEQDRENVLIFMPIKGTDEVRIFDEIKSIPQEEYEGFIELFESIKNGTFKNGRRFTNNEDLKGACEVKGHQIRVVYKRLSENCYGIISIFMKKTQNDSSYRNNLINRYSEYKSMEKELKEKVKDPSFIIKNQEIEKELLETLSNGKGGVK